MKSRKTSSASLKTPAWIDKQENLTHVFNEASDRLTALKKQLNVIVELISEAAVRREKAERALTDHSATRPED